MVSCSISAKYGLLRQTQLIETKPAVFHCLYFLRRSGAHKCTLSPTAWVLEPAVPMRQRYHPFWDAVLLSALLPHRQVPFTVGCSEVTEQFRLEGTSEVYLVQPLGSARVTYSWWPHRLLHLHPGGLSRTTQNICGNADNCSFHFTMTHVGRHSSFQFGYKC